jgi:hypothetical protein
METLMDSIKADHGFNMDSKSVKNLLQTMSELSPTQRRDFLQFVTGSPKLPIGGMYLLLFRSEYTTDLCFQASRVSPPCSLWCVSLANHHTRPMTIFQAS